MHLIIDGYNFMHRSRCGYMTGPHAIIYNFFRSFRALVGSFKDVEKITFVLEGVPQHRNAISDSYKANREVNESDPRYNELVEFHQQKKIIIEILKCYFPINVVKHNDFECDDVIYNLIKFNQNEDIVVVSNDTDFIQLLNEFTNVKIYNPMKKEYVVKTEYDYVTWKCLRGDLADNIPGFKGIGDKTATKLVSNKELLQEFLNKDSNQVLFDHNYSLIKFYTFSQEEYNQIEYSQPKTDWDAVKKIFNDLNFNSITNDKAWNTYVNTFKG